MQCMLSSWIHSFSLCMATFLHYISIACHNSFHFEGWPRGPTHTHAPRHACTHATNEVGKRQLRMLEPLSHSRIRVTGVANRLPIRISITFVRWSNIIAITHYCHHARKLRLVLAGFHLQPCLRYHYLLRIYANMIITNVIVSY